MLFIILEGFEDLSFIECEKEQFIFSLITFPISSENQLGYLIGYDFQAQLLLCPPSKTFY